MGNLYCEAWLPPSVTVTFEASRKFPYGPVQISMGRQPCLIQLWCQPNTVTHLFTLLNC